MHRCPTQNYLLLPWAAKAFALIDIKHGPFVLSTEPHSMPFRHLLLATALIIFAIQPAPAQAPSMYLPALEAVDGTELGLALVNTASTDAQVTVTARTSQGALIADTAIVNPSTLKVPASGRGRSF